MNQLIVDVAKGTATAEVAGRKMTETDQTISDLVSVVDGISVSSVKQAKIIARVRDRALIVRKLTDKTASQLQQQHQYTQGLKSQSAALVKQVCLFVLPEDEVVREALKHMKESV